MPGRRESANKRLGENLRSLRERSGIPQAELARLMSEHGWPWHTSTVYRAETGKQTVSFAEAADLAAIFSTSVHRFTMASEEAAAEEVIYAAGARLRQRYEVVAEAVCELRTEHHMACRTLERYAGSRWDSVQEARADVDARMGMYSLGAAAAEGDSRYRERFGQQEEDSDGGTDPEGQPRVDDQRDA